MVQANARPPSCFWKEQNLTQIYLPFGNSSVGCAVTNHTETEIPEQPHPLDSPEMYFLPIITHNSVFRYGWSCQLSSYVFRRSFGISHLLLCIHVHSFIFLSPQFLLHHLSTDQQLT